MLHSQTSNSAKNMIITATASFVGMLAAMPVALLLVSATQSASAMQTQQNQPTTSSYKQYVEGYTQGYLASVKQDNSSSIDVANCAESGGSAATNNNAQAVATAQTVSATSYKPMSQAAWSKVVNNSYNTYSSSTKTTNNITTTVNKNHEVNINSKNTVNSNNTAVSEVNVKDSNGAVVSTGTAAGGNAMSGAQANNVNSNNTTTTDIDVNVKDSFNTDSHDKTTNITNTKVTTIDDSFNHVDTTINNHTVVNSKKHHFNHV